MIAGWFGLAFAVLTAVVTYAVRQARWQTKHDMWVKSIFRKIALIEKHLGLGVGGEDDDTDNGSGN